jgi:hypothetical protein
VPLINHSRTMLLLGNSGRIFLCQGTISPQLKKTGLGAVIGGRGRLLMLKGRDRKRQKPKVR